LAALPSMEGGSILAVSAMSLTILALVVRRYIRS
jgi:hypothetical protein